VFFFCPAPLPVNYNMKNSRSGTLKKANLVLADSFKVQDYIPEVITGKQ
jgi:hypothetical protein